jgi:hypothetical protein
VKKFQQKIKMAERLLILGEGNFSYTLCLSRDPNLDYIIVSTSIDSFEELQSKYKDFKQIKKDIEKNHNVILMHEINALETEISFKGELFTQIQWNHPHFGKEDFRIHKSILIHFFNSSRQILAPDGVIKITLLRGQELRWEIVNVSNQMGFRLISMDYFDENSLKGYVSKRNMHGKSFKNKHTDRTGKMMPSFIYQFAKGTADIQKQHDLILEEFGAFDAVNLTDKWNEEDEKGKKKLLAPNLNAGFLCEHCQKQLFCERGLKQHIRQVHELKKYPNLLNPTLLICNMCSKDLNSEDALFQHLINKHQVSLDQIHTYLAQSNTRTNDNGYKAKENNFGMVSNKKRDAIDGADKDNGPNKKSNLEYIQKFQIGTAANCELCGWELIGGKSCIERLKPPSSEELKCKCGKAFINPRALSQHSKFCSNRVS